MPETTSLLLDFIFLIWKTLYCLIIAASKWFLPKRYKDISNDTILITGGNRGIGRYIALELADHKPKQVSDEIRPEGGSAIFFPSFRILKNS